ncbi:MAG: OsmC family protein [Acidobacteriota bacterium]
MATQNRDLNESKEKKMNGVDVTALKNTIEAITQDPAMGEFKFRVKNDWINGANNRAEVGGFHGAHKEIEHTRTHIIDADEPAVLLGEDKGANPVETLLAALSGCMTTTLVYKSSALGYKVDAVESSYEGDIDLKGLLEIAKVDQGYREIRVKFKVKGDVPADKIKELVQTSPVFDTLRRPIQIKIDVEKV